MEEQTAADAAATEPDSKMNTEDFKNLTRECRLLRRELVKLKSEKLQNKNALLESALAAKHVPTEIRLTQWRVVAAYDTTVSDFERDNLLLALSAAVQTALLDCDGCFGPSKGAIFDRIQPLCNEALAQIHAAQARPQDLSGVYLIRLNCFRAQFIRQMAVFVAAKQRYALLREARHAYEDAFAVREVVSAVQPSRLQLILAFADLLFFEFEETKSAIELLSQGISEVDTHRSRNSSGISELSQNLQYTMRRTLKWLVIGESYAKLRHGLRHFLLKTCDDVRIMLRGSGKIQCQPAFIISSCLSEVVKAPLGEQEPTERQLLENLRRVKMGEAVRLRQAFRDELQYFKQSKISAKTRLLERAMTTCEGDALVHLTWWRAVIIVDRVEQSLTRAECEHIVTAYYNYLQPLVHRHRRVNDDERDRLAEHMRPMYDEVIGVIDRFLTSTVDYTALHYSALCYFKAKFIQLMSFADYKNAHGMLLHAKMSYERGLEAIGDGDDESVCHPVTLHLAAGLAHLHAVFMGNRERAADVLQRALARHYEPTTEKLALNMPADRQSERWSLLEKLSKAQKNYARKGFWDKVTLKIRWFIHLMFPCVYL